MEKFQLQQASFARHLRVEICPIARLFMWIFYLYDSLPGVRSSLFCGNTYAMTPGMYAFLRWNYTDVIHLILENIRNGKPWYGIPMMPCEQPPSFFDCFPMMKQV